MVGLRDFGKSCPSSRNRHSISQTICMTRRSTPLPESLPTLYCLRWIRSGSKTPPLPTRKRQLVRRIAGHEGPDGQLGRAVFAHYASFLFSVERNCVINILGPRISASDEEGAALRAVMLSGGPISPEITRLLGQAVKKGVIENEQSDHKAATVAGNVLRPAVADVRGDRSARWGLTASDVADVLREAREEIRSSALEVLARWLRK